MLQVILFALLFALVRSEDPEPTGGAACIDPSDCNNQTCAENSTGTFVCVCDEEHGNPDCSYDRYSSQVCGGLQFLCFVGAGGVGNYVMQRTWAGIGQTILLASWLLVLCVGCCGGCCMFLAKEKNSALAGGLLSGFLTILGCVVCAAGIAGWIWCIVDGAYILQGRYVDGNGYALY